MVQVSGIASDHGWDCAETLRVIGYAILAVKRKSPGISAGALWIQHEKQVLERLPEFPLTIAVTAGRTVIIHFLAISIGHLGEVAANAATAAIFPVGDGIAMIMVFALPFMALADPTMKALVIGTGGLRLVGAIHVTANSIAGQSTQQRAAYDAKAVTMTGDAANDASACRAQDRASIMVMTATVIR
jgi:hypothetical protein